MLQIAGAIALLACHGAAGLLQDTSLVQRTAQRELQATAVLPNWVTSLQGRACEIHGNCLVSTGRHGMCAVQVDADKAPSLCSTSLHNGWEEPLVVDSSALSNGSDAACGLTPQRAITWMPRYALSAAHSNWNLCWANPAKKVPSGARRPLDKAARERKIVTLSEKCYWANDLCWLWASPCSGACASVAMEDGLRYATHAEWMAVKDTLVGDKSAFYEKCAAALLDEQYDHCDNSDVLVGDTNPTGRRSSNSSDELVLVLDGAHPRGAGASPTAAPTASPTAAPTTSPTAALGPPPPPAAPQATGDPHLVNMHGQRFDVMQSGVHTLVQVPRNASPSETLLHVEAEAQRTGDACAEIYFQTLNVTGHWAPRPRRPGQQGGMLFFADEPPKGKTSVSHQFGKVGLKVVWGHTAEGDKYLNVFVKRLNKVGYHIGGLLGEDDHTAAATTNPQCKKILSL